MKIAIPYKEGMVNPHFGQSKEFIIFEAEGNKVAGSKIVSNEDLCHNHEGLAGLLKSQGVDVVITGGIGQPMIKALQAMGFEVLTGASGEAAKVASDYLNGTLETANIGICGCGDHDHHGHGC
ncbi:MAG: NifB/NifX family molybdenum-iron cluster-binding protein [Syntrophaceticus sp.]|jgi:predicted Fe-Mo cluster-binding NifX family protein|nr:NifB/NifX family molybdenum-iron cluster-binding protein [Syntrophaceticus sp.]MDD3314378.1 NifB/NifX family molybdenum-iron cluster-binding protein [Syntrophaceticus sp.]MDD4360046.1 NifB/NifX family molybdenum-iron cluster-binding protein [Syntrophaceticus sp.]MDD4783128.1 NifB/NifX family molybdenum-iron cluster-binding protein [Syntrophaceticus sp.]HBG22403.1 diguanylate cyclase [Peptococcaceae bacterium]